MNHALRPTHAAQDISSSGCPVVGVGASAGGLEAFEFLISGMTAEHELALILVQHLDPDHESLLNELLTRRAHVPVRSIVDGMAIEPGNIYVIPPGSALETEGYTMRLSTFSEPRGVRRPIDSFFESLASEHGKNSAAIVLSGTGSDGAIGLRAVSEAGGLTLVQDFAQAKYDGMPRSAIQTGATDLVVPAEDMVAVIRDYFDCNATVAPKLENDRELIARVSKHVLYRTGNDFSHYKPAMLLRRIARRMAVLRMNDPSEYRQRLISDPDEAEKLLNDFLINVTYFFRDAEAFAELKRTVIPALLEGKGRGDDVRVWVPGCSTGQEAYSIAMLLADEMSRLDVRPTVNIFASDIDEKALAVARQGRYPSSIADEIPEEYLRRYFNVSTDGYELRSEMRSMVRFSKHNFAKDAPFSRIDLLSCRNTLIYFDRWLQDKAMEIFHYALKPGGYLFLGPSEHLGDATPKFKPTAANLRIFERLEGPSKSLLLPLVGNRTKNTSRDHNTEATPDRTDTATTRFQKILLERHAPPYVVIDRDQNVLFASEGIDRYLRLRGGALKLKILDLIREELRPFLRRLISAAHADGSVSQETEWSGSLDGQEVRLVLSLEAIDADDQSLVVFRDRLVPRDHQTSDGDGENSITIDQAYVRTIEDDLERARDTLRTTVEELETSNEELKSSNEEMMAMNEELQSANEELTTVNEELQIKVRALDDAYGDLRNFVESTNIATIFLNEKLAIRRFTPEVRRYFRVTDKDHGRAFNDLASDLDASQIVEMCERVIESGEGVEEEMSTVSGDAELRVSVLPYRMMNEEFRGIVILFVPITELRRHAREMENLKTTAERSLAEIEEIYRVSPQAMALMKPDLTYIRVNQRLADINGVPLEDHYGRTVGEVLPDLGNQVIDPIKNVFATGQAILGVSVEGTTPADKDAVHHWEVSWYPIFTGDEVSAVGVNVQDVTRYHEMGEELRRVMRELQHRVKNMLSNVISLVNIAGRSDDDPETVYRTLANRISALSTTHNLLTETHWQGATLRDIVEPELVEVYGQERVTLRGPDVFLNAKAAVAFGMTIHELATNAAKYGALSVDGGTLSVTWSKVDEGDGDHILLRWVERGGPQTGEPANDGFGSRLVQSTIEGSLCGRFERSFEPDGFSALIRVPVTSLEQEDSRVTN